MPVSLATFAFCLFAAPSEVLAKTWSGPHLGVWNTAGNWTPSGAPGAGSDVTILGIGNVASSALTINFNNSNNTAPPNSITFTNPTNSVSILNSSSADRTFGVGAGGITTGSGAVVIGRLTGANGVPIALTANQSWNIGSGGLTAHQRISGAFGITKTGSGTLTLNGRINGVVVGNTYTGDTRIDGGIVVLAASNTIQNSAFDTSSIAGDATNGLRATQTTLTLGGLKGSESFASRFTTTTGGYGGLTALTLNSGTGATHAYSGDIGDGAGAMTLTKIGPGTQILGTSTHTGATAVNEGTLFFSTGAGSSGSNVTVASGATGGVFVAGSEGQHARSGALSLSDTSTLLINYGSDSPNTVTAPLSLDTFTLGTGIALQVEGSVAIGVPYPLVTWTTGPANTAAVNAAFNPVLVNGLLGSLSVSGTTLSVTFSTPPVASWNTGNGTWDTSTANWLKGGVPSTFTNLQDQVIFGDGAPLVTGDRVVTLASTLTPFGMTMDTGGRNYTISGAGTIAGTFGVTLAPTNSGTLTLTTNNTYTGETAINGGTLSLGNGGADGSLAAASAINVAFGTTFVVNQSDTVAQGTDFGAISGGGDFVQAGGGTTVLNSVNTYSGSTSINSGNLEIGGAGRLGNGDYAGDISIAGGSSLQYASTATQTLSGLISGPGSLVKAGTGILILSEANTFEGSTTITGGTLRLGDLNAIASTSAISMADGAILQPAVDGVAIDTPITLGANGTTSQINAPFTPTNTGGVLDTLTLNQPITGDGNLRLFGSSEFVNTNGTIVLNAQNTYAGNTVLDTAGTAVHLAGVNLFVKSGTNNALPATTVLTIDGDVGRGSGRTVQFDLNGFNQELAGLTNVTTGTNLRIQRVTNTGPFATLTVNNSADYDFGSTVDQVEAGTPASTPPSCKIAGNVNLTKSGSGKFTLVGIHQYAGNTTVNEGILSLSADNLFNNASTVTITPGARLNLNFSGTDTVSKLFIGETPKAAGVYGAELSGAEFEIPEITGTGTLTVLPSGYSVWASDNVNNQGPELDFDNDGVPNGVEFFMNSPAGFTANPQLDALNTITWPNGGNIPSSAYGTEFVVQTSPDLSTWTDVLVGDPNLANTAGSVTYTATGGSPNFVRLKVTPN